MLSKGMHALPPRHLFLAQFLGYAGTLPLVAAVCAAYFKVSIVDPLQSARLYSAIIIAFLSGIHWASYIFYSNKCPRNLLATSTACALVAWGSLMYPQLKLALALQSLCLLYLLVLDYKLKEAKILPDWFYALRNNATAIVVVCLMMLEVV